jgi:hypothetical protein
MTSEKRSVEYIMHRPAIRPSRALRREGEHSYSFLDRDDGRRKMVYVARSWENVPSECVVAAAKEIKGLYVYCPEDTKGPEKVEAPKKSQKKEVER